MSQEAYAFAGTVDTVHTTGLTLVGVSCRAFTEGTSIYVREKNSYYILEFSQSNPVDHDLYETALDVPGAQWIKFTAGVAGTLVASNNLSDLTDKAAARTNLGVTTPTSWKDAVGVATTAPGTLASSFVAGQTIDGIVLTLGKRILLKNQAAGAENGIYIVTAGTPTRATDMTTGAQFPGAAVIVQQGTANAGTAWQCTNTTTPTVDTTAITLAAFGGPSAATGASIFGATGAGAHTDLTGRQALTVIMNGTSIRVDVGSSVAEIDFTGLDGENDGGYEVEYMLILSGSGSVVWQPEYDPINGYSRGFDFDTIAHADGSTTTMIVTSDAPNTTHGVITFRSKSGQGKRRYWNQAFEDQTTPAITFYGGYWSDTTTHMTKARIIHTGGAHIDAGSWAVLRKLGKL